MSKKKTISITIDDEVHEEAKRQCALYKLSVSHVVEELLRLFVAIPGGDDENDPR